MGTVLAALRAVTEFFGGEPDFVKDDVLLELLRGRTVPNFFGIYTSAAKKRGQPCAVQGIPIKNRLCTR